MSNNHSETTTTQRSCPCKRLPLCLSSFTAAEYGDVHTLSRKAVVHVNRTDAGGYTALHLAAQNGHVVATAWLLQQNASVDGPQKLLGATPLHRSSFSGAVATMKLLLEANANILAQDSSFGDLMTPLHKAVAGGRYLAVQLLLDTLEERNTLDEGFSMKDSRGYTPLQLAQDIVSNKQLDYSVKRWDVVAGGPPDWNRCISLLQNENENRNVDLGKISLMRTRVPMHFSNFSCLDCDVNVSDKCLTASWESAFRLGLESSVCKTVAQNQRRTNQQGKEKQIDDDSKKDKKMPCTILPVDAKASEKGPLPQGKSCQLCGIESFSFFRLRDHRLVCKSCNNKIRKNLNTKSEIVS